MQPALLSVRFPEGTLPAKGFRCPTCGEERLTATESERISTLGRKLGLYGVEQRRTRKLLKTGGSLAVTLDPEMLRDVLGEVRAGTSVEVGRQGDAIVIRRRKSNA